MAHDVQMAHLAPMTEVVEEVAVVEEGCVVVGVAGAEGCGAREEALVAAVAPH